MQYAMAPPIGTTSAIKIKKTKPHIYLQEFAKL